MRLGHDDEVSGRLCGDTGPVSFVVWRDFVLGIIDASCASKHLAMSDRQQETVGILAPASRPSFRSTRF